MSQVLPLSPDELLSTTRAVRRRLDVERPVERSVIEECLALAQQAPRASNIESRTFVVVTDADKRAALADLWHRGMKGYLRRADSGETDDDPGASRTRQRILASVRHLGNNLHEVPVHVIPCALGRLESLPPLAQGALWGSICPATWSFMLAARSRGLGTCWTSFHLPFEKEAAEILGIPYGEVTQTALIPLAYTIGTDFKPGPREPLDTFVHWDEW